jgi:hypothetical protein
MEEAPRRTSTRIPEFRAPSPSAIARVNRRRRL